MRRFSDGVHYRTIEALEFSIDPKKKLIPTLDKLRKKRNTGSYDDFGLVSQGEADSCGKMAVCVQIELFFRALKQSLRVKTFVGTSANALKTQLWTALIAMLLVKYLQLRSTFGWSLSNLVALLRQQLFVYRDLWTWIDDPFQPPISASLPKQLALQLA
jgi:hypothetical protein